MKTTIESVTATSQIENAAIISMVSAKIKGLTRFEEAYAEVNNIVSKVLAFDCGRGANHIWVANWKGERLMLITQ